MAAELNRANRIHLIYLLIAFVLFTAAQMWWADYRKVEVVPYSQFEKWLADDAIAVVAITDDRIQGTLKDPLPDGAERFRTVRVDPEIAEQLSAHDVTFTGVIEDTFLADLLSWVLPIALFFVIWLFFVRRMAERQGLGGPLALGRSKAKVYVETEIKVTFADVAGVDEARSELEEIVDFLKRPAEHGRLGARVPKGVLLVGPPGTGKTLLARAVAGEAGVPFFSISGSEFVEMFVGVGAARVRDLFEQARKAAPSIIFIDELDALGKSRGLGFPGGHDEKEQTLNQLLAELDGFDPREGIVLLAATNRPEILDPALLRAGRFDRQILVDRPDRNGRRAILEVHAKKVLLEPDTELDQIAALTPGFTGADLANLVNEAALLATRRGADAINLDDFTAAIERIVAGVEKKSRLMSEPERRTVAYHEMGHALVASSLPGVDPVHKISIIPRGIGSLGYTIQRPTEDRFLLSRSDLFNRITVLLGGRAAERLVFGDVSTGASDDLDKATEIARSMVTRFGMSDQAGQIVYERERQAFLDTGGFGTSAPRSYGEKAADTIDAEIRRLVDEGLAAATEILERRREDLEAGAALLLEKEVINARDFPPLQPASAAADGDRHGQPAADQASATGK